MPKTTEREYDAAIYEYERGLETINNYVVGLQEKIEELQEENEDLATKLTNAQDEIARLSRVS